MLEEPRSLRHIRSMMLWRGGSSKVEDLSVEEEAAEEAEETVEAAGVGVIVDEGDEEEPWS